MGLGLYDRTPRSLEVERRMLPFVLLVLVGLVMVPLGLLGSIQGLQEGNTPVIAIGLFLLISFAGIVWLVRNGLSKSVKHLTNEGLERGDGRRFVWADLSHIVDQGQGSAEIRFRNGEKAYLMWLYIKNSEEVMTYLLRLFPGEIK